MCLVSDRGAWAKITGLCVRVAYAENNNSDFELRPKSHVTFELNIQEINGFYTLRKQTLR